MGRLEPKCVAAYYVKTPTKSMRTRMMEREYNHFTVEVAASADEVYAVFTNVSHWPQWVREIKQAKFVKGWQWKAGAKIALVPKKLPPLMPNITVTLFDVKPNRRVRWGVKIPGGEQFHEFRFTPLENGGCQIENREWATGIMAVLAAPVGEMIFNLNRHWTDNLAAHFS